MNWAPIAAMMLAGPVAAEAPAGPEAPRIFEVLSARATEFSIEERRLLAMSLEHAARREGIDPYLVLAVIEVETGFRRHRKSHAGARGLMQLMPTTARATAKRNGIAWAGMHTLRDPSANVQLGTAYLARLLRRFKRVDLALTAYCHGPGRVAQLLREGAVPQERLRYSKKVLRAYRRLAPPADPAPLG